MESIDTFRVLEIIIDFFEAGNQKTDAAAKAIFESDLEYGDYWRGEIQRLRKGVEWTGIRCVEAEILTSVLHRVKESIRSEDTLL